MSLLMKFFCLKFMVYKEACCKTRTKLQINENATSWLDKGQTISKKSISTFNLKVLGRETAHGDRVEELIELINTTYFEEWLRWNLEAPGVTLSCAEVTTRSPSVPVFEGSSLCRYYSTCHRTHNLKNTINIKLTQV